MLYKSLGLISLFIIIVLPPRKAITNTTGVVRLTAAQFTRITEGPHVTNPTRANGVSWIDYNDDNYIDIYVANARDPMQNNCLYENNGDGTFTQITDLAIVNDDNFSTGAVWADYDNDDDLDIFVSAHRTHPNLFYVNNGDGSFTLDTDTPLADSVVGSTSPSWIDYNNDGDLDLFVGNSTCGPCTGYPPYRNFLFQNIGGVFSEVTSGEIVTIEKHTYGATWCDYDNDGDVDLLDPNQTEEQTDLFRNDGGGSFVRITSEVINSASETGGHSSWADYDNDGDMDLFLGGVAPGANLLYDNNGDGTFSEAVATGLGLATGKANNGSWVDYDNDGDQDVLIWSNMYDFSVADSDSCIGVLFENTGGTFTELEDTLFFSDACLAAATVWGDYDRDGDLDLFVPTLVLSQATAPDMFFRNEGNSNNWITVRCIGTVSNRSAIGAKVRVRANIFGASIWQMREITTQIEPTTQPPLEAHFGLGDAIMIDSIAVEWPGGSQQFLTDIEPNQLLVIEEKCCLGIRGNANGDGAEDVNISDITYLVEYLFGIPLGPAPECLQEGNANGDESEDLNISDITYLVDYLFGIPLGPEPPECSL